MVNGNLAVYFQKKNNASSKIVWDIPFHAQEKQRACLESLEVKLNSHLVIYVWKKTQTTLAIGKISLPYKTLGEKIKERLEVWNFSSTFC